MKRKQKSLIAYGYSDPLVLPLHILLLLFTAKETSPCVFYLQGPNKIKIEEVSLTSFASFLGFTVEDNSNDR